MEGIVIVLTKINLWIVILLNKEQILKLVRMKLVTIQIYLQTVPIIQINLKKWEQVLIIWFLEYLIYKILVIHLQQKGIWYLMITKNAVTILMESQKYLLQLYQIPVQINFPGKLRIFHQIWWPM